MKLHEIIEVHEEPYFRKMRVESGFMYNFFDKGSDNYRKEWIFVPAPEDVVIDREALREKLFEIARKKAK